MTAAAGSGAAGEQLRNQMYFAAIGMLCRETIAPTLPCHAPTPTTP